MAEDTAALATAARATAAKAETAQGSEARRATLRLKEPPPTISGGLSDVS